MSKPETQSCGNCRFAYHDDNRRRCHRNPPQWVTSGEYEIDWKYPAVRGDEWCGEWQPETPATVDEAAKTLALFVQLGDLTAARALVDRIQELK